MSVSGIADERDEATKLRAARCCALCVVCCVYVRCFVCVVLCAVCRCSAVCVCVVLCVLRFVRDTPHGRHTDSPTGSMAIRNCANLSLPICRHPQSTTTRKRRNCGMFCCQQRRNCGIRLAAAIIDRSVLTKNPSPGSGHSPAYLVCFQLLDLSSGSLCLLGRVLRPRKVARLQQGLRAPLEPDQDRPELRSVGGKRRFEQGSKVLDLFLRASHPRRPAVCVVHCRVWQVVLNCIVFQSPIWHLRARAHIIWGRVAPPDSPRIRHADARGSDQRIQDRHKR